MAPFPSLYPNSDNGQSTRLPGPQDWIVSAIMRKSILYFQISPLKSNFLKIKPKLSCDKEKELKGNKIMME